MTSESKYLSCCGTFEMFEYVIFSKGGKRLQDYSFLCMILSKGSLPETIFQNLEKNGGLIFENPMIYLLPSTPSTTVSITAEYRKLVGFFNPLASTKTV